MSARPACSEAERGQALPVGALRRLWALWVVEIIPQPSRARWRSGHGHSSNYINSKTSRLAWAGCGSCAWRAPAGNLRARRRFGQAMHSYYGTALDMSTPMLSVVVEEAAASTATPSSFLQLGQRKLKKLLPSKRRGSSSTARPAHPQARHRQRPSLSFSPHWGRRTPPHPLEEEILCAQKG